MPITVRNPMSAFPRIEGSYAPLPIANLQTHDILPPCFPAAGEHLFHELRYQADGNERPDFILNRMPWRQAKTLVVWENFGCGLEHPDAAQALYNFGFGSVITPSFGASFDRACINAGIVPIIMPQAEVDNLMKYAAKPEETLIVLLDEQILTCPHGCRLSFNIDAQDKAVLMRGCAS